MINALLTLLILVVTIRLLPYFAKIFFYIIVLVFLLIKTAVPWIISALYALTFCFFALVRQLFTGENAKAFLEQTLPPREVKHETLSLVLIELMIDFHKKL